MHSMKYSVQKSTPKILILKCYRSITDIRHGNSAHITKELSELEKSFDQKEMTACEDRKHLLISCLQDKTFLKPYKLCNPKTVVIDFSSPNIAKPFHVGHLRSTIIGNFIANIYKYFNNNVIRINYLGDWGTQIGLLQYGLQALNIDTNTLTQNPISKLYEAYVYANKLSSVDENIQETARKYFTDMEQGRVDLANWKQIREITVCELEKTYKRLGVKFDEYHWESDYNANAIKDLMALLMQNNILIRDESDKIVARIDEKNITVLKSDNSTLYITRDIAALLDRHERYHFDNMLYVVDNAQSYHFSTLIKIVSQINKECSDKCKHIKFGRIKGMSTRKGNVVFLKDILDEAKDKLSEMQKKSKNTRLSAINEQTCDILGSTAVIINDLKQKRQKDYLFEWDKALQSEGDSGIKLQYLHCRLWSLEKKNAHVQLPIICNAEYLTQDIVLDVITEISYFPKQLHRSLIEHEACYLVHYLFRLANRVNRMYNEINVMNAEPEVAGHSLLVFNSARLVLKTALEILGLKVLNEM